MTANVHDRQAVVFHVTDLPADIDRAISAATRLMETRPATTARIIVNGAALTGLLGTDALGAPTDVSIEACEFGLGQRGLSASDLREGIGTVPSAVVAIADAQRDGASYIRV